VKKNKVITVVVTRPQVKCPQHKLVSWSLTSLLQHKYGYIRDERQHKLVCLQDVQIPFCIAGTDVVLAYI